MTNDGWGSSKGWGDVLGWDNKLCDSTQPFTFNYDGKTHTEEAFVIGDLAVICGQEPFWILHIHTKACFDKAIPNGNWKVEELIEWCKRVQESNQEAWFNLKLVNDHHDWSNNLNVRARGRILEWCRSVRVK